jgi:N,N'-diacetyllegionaminate synthase
LKSFKLGNKIVGDNHPCYTIAEIGGLFQNFEEAVRLIDSAVEMNVDAVKFQTLEAETITTKNNFFDMEATGNVSQYEIFKEFELSKELQKKVVKYANKKNITIFSAPSHMKDLDIMKEMDLPVFKIGSDLACHIPLLKEIAKLGKPIILSTGMCTLEEVRNSVDAIISMGNEQLALMHCVSNYPTKVEEENLNAILTMKKEFGLPVGMSDHCIGTTTTLASVIMGANLIERHFRDIQNKPSPDDIHSLTKQEFSNLIQSIRDFEKARGTGIKIPTKSEEKNREKNRVSIIAMKKIPKGSIIQKNMIDIRRPGTGIQPIDFWKVIGKKTTKSIEEEEPLKWDFLE